MAVINEVIGGDTYGVEKRSNIIKNPEAVLDVGGHIGTFGLLAKRHWPNILLIAIEPNFISYLLYCKNMQENGCKKYYILNRALGYSSKTACLLEENTTSGGGHTRSKLQDIEISKAKGYRITYSSIPTITIEEIIDTFSIEKIGLSKWDCEGCENEVFSKISKQAASVFRYIVGEYHITDNQGRHLGGNLQDYLNFFKKAEEKFSHLKFEYPDKSGALGKFGAYPKP